MRKVIKIKGRKLAFQVSDDPEGLIGLFLAKALTDNDYMPNEIAQLLLPDGEGYYLNGTICAYRLDDIQDLPTNYSYLAGDNVPAEDIWVIFKEQKTHPYPTIALYSNELYQLFEEAMHLVGF